MVKFYISGLRVQEYAEQKSGHLQEDDHKRKPVKGKRYNQALVIWNTGWYSCTSRRQVS